MNDKIVKAMPAAADHAPLSILNRTGRGVRTLIVCSCEWHPDDPGELYTDMTGQHTMHRIAHRKPALHDYSGVVFGEGPWMGMTWNDWYDEFGRKTSGLDPYTGKVRTFS